MGNCRSNGRSRSIVALISSFSNGASPRLPGFRARQHPAGLTIEQGPQTVKLVQRSSVGVVWRRVTPYCPLSCQSCHLDLAQIECQAILGQGR
jgi:hypothetical protein